MAASDVQTCNRALQLLGVDPITALSDNSKAAREMNVAFESVRRAEIRRRRWNFAIARVSIPALSAAPDSDYSYQYQLPNDYLRLLPGGDLRTGVSLTDYRDSVDGLYSVEGGRILTNLPAPLSIRYLRDVTDAASRDPAFEEAFSVRLAMAACHALTESHQKKQDLDSEYRRAIREASQANAFEKPSEHAQDDTWVMARTQ